MTVLFYTFIVFGSIFFFYIDQITREKYQTHLILILFIFLTIVSSFRWEVGGDWQAYYKLSKLSDLFLWSKLLWSPVFIIINYVASKLSLGIFGVNLFLSIFLFSSFYLFSKTLNLNILLLSPILITVIYFLVLMGYVRQCLALSFFLLFLRNLVEGNIFKSFILLFLSTLTHISAFFFFPIILVYTVKNYSFKSKSTLVICVILIICLLFFLLKNFNQINVSYELFVEGNKYISKGVSYRFFPSIIGLICFVYFRKKIIKKYLHLEWFFYYTAFLIVFFSGIVLFGYNFSTILDRLSIYNVAFYFIIVSFVYDSLKSKKKDFHIVFLSFIYSMHLSIFIVWQIMGDYSIFWTNYKFLQ